MDVAFMSFTHMKSTESFPQLGTRKVIWTQDFSGYPSTSGLNRMEHDS